MGSRAKGTAIQSTAVNSPAASMPIMLMLSAKKPLAKPEIKMRKILHSDSHVLESSPAQQKAPREFSEYLVPALGNVVAPATREIPTVSILNLWIV